MAGTGLVDSKSQIPSLLGGEVDPDREAVAAGWGGSTSNLAT
jgi:hypothetical protein